jgi:hypothetical protein
MVNRNLLNIKSLPLARPARYRKNYSVEELSINKILIILSHQGGIKSALERIEKTFLDPLCETNSHRSNTTAISGDNEYPSKAAETTIAHPN